MASAETDKPNRPDKQDRPYHHGDLRHAILTAALDVITADGPAGLSLRDLARRAGVSHAAPAHHFRDRTGLLTAIAAEGFALLAAALNDASDLKDAGVRYVRFAREHPAHFQVMFAPGLLRADDLELTTARALATDALRTSVSAVHAEDFGIDSRLAGVAAWSSPTASPRCSSATTWTARSAPVTPRRCSAPSRPRCSVRPELTRWPDRGSHRRGHPVTVPRRHDPRIDVRNSPTQPSNSRPTSGFPPTFAVFGRGTSTWCTAGLMTVPG